MDNRGQLPFIWQLSPITDYRLLLEQLSIHADYGIMFTRKVGSRTPVDDSFYTCQEGKTFSG